DVVVVGAGAAGLAAAHELRRLKRDFILLESRDRIGGRVFTETALGAPYDAGAFYIHWADRNPWASIARDLGVATAPDTPQGAFRNFVDGVEAQAAASAARRRQFARLSALLDGEGVADVSIAQAARAADPALGEAADGLARFAVGEEPQRVSARDYARLWSGEDLVVPSGYGALVQAYGRDVPVRTGVRVTAIDWSGRGVVVETNAGAIRAGKAIVTTSIGVLKSGAIRFAPDLPAATREALDGLEMGALSKIGMSFDFAKLDVARGDIFSRRQGNGGFDFECRSFGRDLVVAIFGGDFARDVARTDEDAVAHALDAFADVVGARARGAFKGACVNAWFRDPAALGCYSHCLPGHADAREKLALPVGERLYFAGEATGMIGGAMTAGGAALAGRQAAGVAAA
ncbi:MAG: FAD-dependent oxidoreductase, partial [Hyphomicrobiales bacterium]|nr:FAD-dependent oxidoreductase [Hyphomicrobiales bacterium]